MSSESYYDWLPTIGSLHINPIVHSYGVPRSYHHSSDDSDSGGGEKTSSQTYDTPPNYTAEDTPFIPRRSNSLTPTHVEPSSSNRSFVASEQPLILSPDYPYTPEFDADPLKHSPVAFFQQHQRQGSGSYLVDSRHTPSNHGFTREQHSFPGHPSSAPSASHVVSSRPTPTHSQSLPGSGSSSAYNSQDVSPPSGGHHPSAFVNTAPTYPDAGDYLRRQLSMPSGHPVSLASLDDPLPGQKPTQSLPILVKLAIYGSPKKRLTLQEIYQAIEQRFEWYRDPGNKSWKNSIRHNLSLNKVFRNTHRSITEPGKGAYWELDISEGEGYKRERKRRKQNRPRRGDDAEEDQIADDDCDSSRSSNAGSPSAEEYMHGFPAGPSSTAASASNASRAHRGRPATRRMSPYPQGTPQMLPFAGSSQPIRHHSQPQAGINSQHVYQPSTVDPRSTMLNSGSASPQPSFGQSSLVPQQSFHGQQPASQPYGQQGFMRPLSRTDPFSTSPTEYVPMGHTQPTGTHAIRGIPHIQQHFPGYVPGSPAEFPAQGNFDNSGQQHRGY